MEHTNQRSIALSTKILAIFAVVFGCMTIFSGSSILFASQQAQTWAGDYVPFVLWFNFLAGFVYVITGLGALYAQGWARTLALVLATTSLLVCLAFFFHIWRGGAFEMRTVGALIFRVSFWLVMVVVLTRNGKMQATA